MVNQAVYWSLFIFILLCSTLCKHIEKHGATEMKNLLTKRIECELGLRHVDCPVDGSWSAWSKWSECEGACGQTGVRRRTRSCNNPRPLNNGFKCTGESCESKLCRLKGCSLQEYKSLVGCDELRQSALLVIEAVHEVNPSLVPRCVEDECHYEIVEQVLAEYADSYWNALHCVKHNNGCPVPGGWSQWSPWSECSALCGQGRKIRCRTCTDPLPTYPHHSCPGQNCTYTECLGTDCAVAKYGYWGEWSTWSLCSSSCGHGLRSRERQCLHETYMPPYHLGVTKSRIGVFRNPTPANKSCRAEAERFQGHRPKRDLGSVCNARDVCLGPRKEILPCFIHNCPVDGSWSEWEPWSQCSKDCSLGIQSRSRACSSPPPSRGGSSCEGPVSWIRHCFDIPCQRAVGSVGSFVGDGALAFYKTATPSRLLHLYLVFRPSTRSGDLIRREDSACFASSFLRTCNNVRLQISAGYLVLTADISGCSLNLATYDQIEVNQWTKVLIMITAAGATIRLNENEDHYTSPFSCIPAQPEFDSDMIVGHNFKGDISHLVVNFKARNLNLGSSDGGLQRIPNISPYSNINVAYNDREFEEDVLTLDDLILAPCTASDLQWSISLVVKIESPEGAILIIKDFYNSEFLLLFAEPYRIVLQMEDGTCVTEVYHQIESLQWRWLIILISYNHTGSIGLQVNGGKRKEMMLTGVDRSIKCRDNIYIGNIEELIRLEKNHSRAVQYIGYMKSASGLLAYLNIDGNDISLDTLPSLSKASRGEFSSETISYPKQYQEIKIENGHPMRLVCLYYYDESDEDIFARLYWNHTNPVWARFDSIITPCEQMPWGVTYYVENDEHQTTLTADNYTKETIEGFYSCWLPRNSKEKPNKILITYGVTVVHKEMDFRHSNHKVLMYLGLGFIAVFFISVISLICEHIQNATSSRGFPTGMGMVKKIDRDVMYIFIHSPDVKERLGIKNKLVGKITALRRRVWENRELLHTESAGNFKPYGYE